MSGRTSPIQILAHRGIWQGDSDKNSLKALTLALESGFGVEFDVRHFAGSLVISHDPPMRKGLSLYEFFQEACQVVKLKALPLAVNVKCDGIEEELLSLIRSFALERSCFMFDMSVPTVVRFLQLAPDGDIQLAARISDYEPLPVLASKCTHLWVDCFETDWCDPTELVENVYVEKSVVFVSSELHGRSPEALWSRLRSLRSPSLLCTDFPEKARRFFDNEP